MKDEFAPLVPLTPEQQEQFDKHRETDAVVQDKCTACGQWYESVRGAALIKQSFVCSCGNLMEFDIPPVAVSLMPPPRDLLTIDQTFDTGMKVSEALARAETWWDKVGRHGIQKHEPGTPGAFSSPDKADENFIPSGVINALPWDELSKREKLLITKAWHHHHIRKPQTV